MKVNVKTCPNCGAEMEADVNFCTECGNDIKNVPVNPVSSNSQPVMQTQNGNQNQYNQTQNYQAPIQPQTRSSQNQTFSRVSEVVKNFDKENLWKWFVTSWKTPSAEQQGEKWYGIVTLLLEMIIFSWAFGAGIKKAALANIHPEALGYFQAKTNSFFHSLSFDQFLLVFITGAGVIVAAYVAHKFVYNDSLSVWNLINQIVQLSNINAILVLVLSLICWTNLQSSIALILGLMLFIGLLFMMAGAYTVHENQPGQRDTFYGIIIYLVIVAAFIAIAYFIVKGQIVSQIQSTFEIDITKYLDPNNIHF